MENLALAAAKRRAHYWLVGAGLVFCVSLFLPPMWWQGALKACAEAALVGGLAFWDLYRLVKGLWRWSEKRAVV